MQFYRSATILSPGKSRQALLLCCSALAGVGNVALRLGRALGGAEQPLSGVFRRAKFRL